MSQYCCTVTIDLEADSFAEAWTLAQAALNKFQRDSGLDTHLDDVSKVDEETGLLDETGESMHSGNAPDLIARARRQAGRELGDAAKRMLSATVAWQFNQALQIMADLLPTGDPAYAVIDGIWKGMEKT